MKTKTKQTRNGLETFIDIPVSEGVIKRTRFINIVKGKKDGKKTKRVPRTI
jgi:hypothetical protein